MPSLNLPRDLVYNMNLITHIMMLL